MSLLYRFEQHGYFLARKRIDAPSFANLGEKLSRLQGNIDLDQSILNRLAEQATQTTDIILHGLGGKFMAKLFCYQGSAPFHESHPADRGVQGAEVSIDASAYRSRHEWCACVCA